MRAIRNGLYGAGIPVECSKGEAEIGQEEINVRYSDALDTADMHAITKNGCKEIAFPKGRSVTFMAKYDHARAGSSSHVHQSLWTLDGAPAFLDPRDEHGMSDLMRHYVAGQLAHAQRDHLFPRALCQQLQALRRRPVRADQGGVDASTTAPRGSGSAARAPRRSASNAGSAGPT